MSGRPEREVMTVLLTGTFCGTGASENVMYGTLGEL